MMPYQLQFWIQVSHHQSMKLQVFGTVGGCKSWAASYDVVAGLMAK